MFHLLGNVILTPLIFKLNTLTTIALFSQLKGNLALFEPDFTMHISHSLGPFRDTFKCLLNHF